MDNNTFGQPPAPQAPMPGPAPAPQVIAPTDAPVGQPMQMPPTASIYPTPAPTPTSASFVQQQQPQTYSQMPASSFGSRSSSGGSYPLILAGTSVLLFPTLIFAPGLIDSMGAAAAWIVFALVLSGASIFLAVKQQKKSADVNTSAIVAIALASVMFVTSIILGSYYIKLQMTLNAFKNSVNNYNSTYKSSSSSSSSSSSRNR